MTAEEEHAPPSQPRPKYTPSASPRSPALQFKVFEQLKQRNVIRVAVLYLVVCWLILDPVHVVFHMLEVPAWANRLVVMLMAVGFPAVVIFAWVYEITPEGLKPTVEVPHGQSIRKLTGRRLDRAIIAVLAVALTYFVVDKFWISKRPGGTQTQSAASPVTGRPPPVSAAVFAPPPHSIAVLPFVNLSGDKEQEYFSDGLTEELLNSLAEIEGLQVAARTSSFSFKEHPDIATVAHKLNVGAVLEGSVRRSSHTVRITAQLINAVTGFHLWSKTYDRNLDDVLKLQTDIATAVASALKVTLLGDLSAKIELGGTHNPAAFDAYLRASKILSTVPDAKDFQTAVTAYSEAARLDPNYALAFAGRSLALAGFAQEFATGPAIREGFAKAQADARHAIALAPELADGHLALAFFFESGSLDFTQASEEYERALALAPGSVRVLRQYATFAVHTGRASAGIAAARRAAVLDPLSSFAHNRLGSALYFAHRYEEALAALNDALALDPESQSTYGARGLAYYQLGDFPNSLSSCETKPDNWVNQWCLSVTYDKLGRHADAEAVLAKLKAALGDASAYQYATIYAQWGDRTRALEWLETALRLRDPGLVSLKTDPLLDSLRKEPRFLAVERALKFPT
jgi:TolB-like protein/tetratricopeptide (TPR) repeat protein